METRRLELLVALARLGSMRAVGEELGITTSTVSQQLAALAAETGSTLLEPVGRHVRLTPAGRRLADHGVTILAAVEAARRDLDVDAEPTGTVRIAGFASAIRRSLIPLLPELRRTRPRLRVVVAEHEPEEALTLIAQDRVDLAVVYDFPPAMRVFDDRVEATPLWTARWGLGVPAALEQPDRPHVGRVRVWPGAGPARGRATRPRRPTRSRRSGRYRDHEWIVNSRNDADVARPDRPDPRAPRVARPPRPRRAALLRAAAAPLTIVLDSLCGGAC